MKRHRRPLSPRLLARRRRVNRQTKALVRRVERGLSSPAATANGHGTAGSVTELRKTLHGVRHDVSHGGGDHAGLVTSALGDLDHSLAKLSRSFATADPNTRLRLLADAKHALDRAQAKARKAGHDWPL